MDARPAGVLQLPSGVCKFHGVAGVSRLLLQDLRPSAAPAVMSEMILRLRVDPSTSDFTSQVFQPLLDIRDDAAEAEA